MGNFVKPQDATKKVEVVKTPSHFGSHASMETAESKQNNGPIVQLRDEKGVYETERKRLDDGLADPNRYTDR
jgi:hypothetical protein